MKINKHVAVSDSGFVFNPITGESFSANPLGIEIIEMLKKDFATAEIYKAIREKYHTEQSTVEKDIVDFFELMRSYSLLEHNETTED